MESSSFPKELVLLMHLSNYFLGVSQVSTGKTLWLGNKLGWNSLVVWKDRFPYREEKPQKESSFENNKTGMKK